MFDKGLTVEKRQRKSQKLNKLVISDDVTNLTRNKPLFLLFSLIVGNHVIHSSKFHTLVNLHRNYARSV